MVGTFSVERRTSFTLFSNFEMQDFVVPTFSASSHRVNPFSPNNTGHTARKPERLFQRYMAYFITRNQQYRLDFVTNNPHITLTIFQC